jgi:CheY-like chemotaxis protein
MISQCPYCNKDLNLTDAQKEKVSSALANLKSGTLKLGCPHCREPIQLLPDGSPFMGGTTAQAGVSRQPAQPAYPDISWLASGLYSEKKTVEDIPKVLVLMPDGKARDFVVKTFEDIGYQVDIAESSTDAIAKMRFVSFAAVVMHTSMDKSLEDSAFHAYMRAMPMDKRRYL